MSATIDRERLASILDAAAEALARLRALSEERDELRAAAGALQGAMQTDPNAVRRYGPDPTSTRRLTELQGRIRRITERHAQLHAELMPSIELARRCQTYAAQHGVETSHAI